MNNLSALRERVEKADTTDPIALGQIANEIAEAFYGPDYTQEHWSEWATPLISIDAAVALIERKGWRVYKLDASIEGRFCWTLKSKEPRLQILGDPDNPDRMVPLYNYVSAFGSDICLALIAALLNALEATNG